MPDRLEIANLALKHLGQKLISSLDANHEDARVLKSSWYATVRRCLEAANWNFALRRAALPSGPTPAFGYSNSYARPADCLRIASVARSTDYRDEDPDYSDENGYILSNSDLCFLLYVSSEAVDREGDWTQSFADFVAASLAFDTCVHITGNQELRSTMSSIVDMTRKAATSVDVLQNSSKTLMTGRWSRAGRMRNGGFRDPQGRF